MSRLIAIALSGFILIQSFHIGAEDILQIDELIEHAQFHKQEYGDSFFVFVSKHYGELKGEHSKNHQEEQSDHEQLPFQCQGHGITITAFLPFYTSNSFNDYEGFKSVESNFHYLNSYSSLHKEKLLQPPKHA
ncbi:hypothetical protein SAMN05421824_0321 [Hyunsoonleella jejuensis]|uniref:Uncharacterized protein n=1 Tax=Hyunsoonleella jejuensis TaxID=419940 RepID=A0A1H9AQZ7_9FLAO|nr:hypothetical protein [Hyunsoonleella jejuensis]SEP78975.1 hypothetical protein SAMN05421824_0321 [Hyunsoonleella jejuensis]